MQTKKELSEALPNDIFGDILDQIDFDNLDKFVNLLVSGYVTKNFKII